KVEAMPSGNVTCVFPKSLAGFSSAWRCLKFSSRTRHDVSRRCPFRALPFCIHGLNLPDSLSLETLSVAMESLPIQMGSSARISRWALNESEVWLGWRPPADHQHVFVSPDDVVCSRLAVKIAK